MKSAITLVLSILLLLPYIAWSQPGYALAIHGGAGTLRLFWMATDAPDVAG